MDIVEVWLVVASVSSLDMEAVLVSSSGLELVDFHDLLVDLLNSLGSLDSGCCRVRS